jgi:toxin-antitoxin system PIN domain toxin
MKVVDTNVLIYAVNSASPHHNSARSWLTTALRGHETVGIPWVCSLAFIRICTNARIMDRPLTPEQACRQVEGWLSQRIVVTVEPSPRHVTVLAGLLSANGVAGNLTNDAHLAALALEHSATVVTFDRDFERFGVPVLVPPRPSVG